MKVLSSKEAAEKLLNWKRSHVSLKLVITGMEEIAGIDIVAVFDVNVETGIVQLTGGPKGYGFSLEDALITGDVESLDILFGNARYLLVESRSN
jgi:hypothetical protein